MHEEVTVVIPGAINELQVMKNAEASGLSSISNLKTKIRSIYEKFIKSDVHDRWQ